MKVNYKFQLSLSMRKIVCQAFHGKLHYDFQYTTQPENYDEYGQGESIQMETHRKMFKFGIIACEMSAKTAIFRTNCKFFTVFGFPETWAVIFSMNSPRIHSRIHKTRS